MSSLVEKFRNKKVFILYLVGVLLLSTSVSFAYFTSRTNASGEGGVAVGTTTTIESTGINAEGTIEFNNVDMYPGHIGIAGIKVIATGTTPMIYNIIFNGTNTFTTPLNYTVYKTTTEIDVSYTCTKKEERQGVNTIYYEECTGNNIEQLGTEVSSGTIHTNEGKTTLLDSEIILGTEEGAEVYYYVVIEFPNEEESQNDDIGSNISGNITIEEGSEYKNPEVTLTGTTVSGNNGWVKSASINVNVTSQTGKYEALYCTTTEDSCTPNTSANIGDNTFSVTLNNNSSAQKVCVEVTDEYNQIASGCSETYNVDGEIPTVTIASTSVTENSITVTVNGSDIHSGIVQYKFSSNNGSSYTTVSSTNNSYTYTFNNLNDGTTYTIAVQAVDEAGNVSNKVTKKIATESGTAGKQLLENYPTRLTRNNFDTTIEETTTGTIYYADTSKGRTYYFAGNPTDNWVEFAGFYWRIIRINEDGSIRLIHSTQIGESEFNPSYADNMYVGYMYQSNRVHGLQSDSSIKRELDSWYWKNLQDYEDKISIDAGFCGDREPSTSDVISNGRGGTGTTITYYGAYIRLYTNKEPTFECQNDSDLYTVASSSQGNKVLDYPIGLITADEVAYAGGYFWQSDGSAANKFYYLYSGEYYWTMTPSSHEYNNTYVFRVNSDGCLDSNQLTDIRGVRPVINLSPDVTITGSGTTSDPYTVVGAS